MQDSAFHFGHEWKRNTSIRENYQKVVHKEINVMYIMCIICPYLPQYNTQTEESSILLRRR